ncbi:MAG: hypothetical protein AB7O48_09645 [Cyclobacteriaceae bacterium]
MTKPLANEASGKLSEVETTEMFQLIDGTFDVTEAQETLIGLLNHKIQFHELKNFSWKERYGVENDHSCKRLKELNKDRERLSAVLEFAEQNKLNIEIQSKVKIHLTK